MAIDTSAKIDSMLNFGSIEPTFLPVPDGSVSESDRFHFLGLYYGLSIAQVVTAALTGTITNATTETNIKEGTS